MLGCVSARRKFRGILEPDGTSLNWTVVRVPFDPATAWPQRQRRRVRGTINGFSFRTSLFQARDGRCILLVNKQMQKGAGVTLGSLAEVVLEPDLEMRIVATPPELEKLLRRHRALKKWHDQLSASIRKWIAETVAQPKSPAVRASRAERMAEQMMLAMEGERVLPPLLEAAFQRQPRARAGWKAMTSIQRRGHLLGIFHYQSPESREKRARKAVDEALRIAAKRQQQNP